MSINPLRHVDLFGTIILPAMLLLMKAGFLFGYAKPVPVNFNRLHKPRRDMVFVAAAGPAINLVLGAGVGLPVSRTRLVFATSRSLVLREHRQPITST